MSLSRVISGLWRNHEETCENASDPNLKTRYYQMRSDELTDKILSICEQFFPKWKTIHIDKERNEIIFEKQELIGKSDIVISIYPISPYRSAVDMVSAKRGLLGDLGASYRNVIRFFEVLNRQIPSATSNN